MKTTFYSLVFLCLMAASLPAHSARLMMKAKAVESLTSKRASMADATNITTSSVTIEWSEDPEASEYVIYQDGVFIDNISTTTYTFTGLTPGQTYTFEVNTFVMEELMEYPWGEVTVTTLSEDTEAPTSPANLIADSISYTSLILSWTASSDNTGVEGYHVYQDGTLLSSTSSLTLDVSGLSSNTTYLFAVEAYDAAGNESATTSTSATTLQDTDAPTDPTNVTVSTGGEAAHLSWSQSTDNVGVTGYYVSAIEEGGTSSANTRHTTSTEVDIWNLSEATTYTFTLRAYDAAGNESAGVIMVATTQDITTPSVPANLSVSNMAETSLTLSWSSSTDNVAVDEYAIYQDGVLLVKTADTTYDVSGLLAGTEYTFEVEASDASNNTSALTALTTSTIDVTAPSAPGNFTASDIGETSLTLNWSAASDNGTVEGYNVYQEGTLLGTTIDTSFSVTGLAIITRYIFHVEAYDASGNVSDASDLVVFTRDLTAPEAPANLTVDTKTETSIMLSWSYSSDNVAVEGYNLYKDGILASTITNPTHTVTGLSEGTTYTFTVTAWDSSGNESAQSESLSVTTDAAYVPDMEPPMEPMNLTATNISMTGMTFNWDEATDNVGVAGYNVYVDAVFAGSVFMNSYELTGLTEGTTYTLSVEAYDEAGNMSTMATITAATEAAITSVIISEYVEGTAQNNAIEIANIGNTTVDLSNYTLKRKPDGIYAWNNGTILQGTLAPGETHVIIHLNAYDPELIAKADQIPVSGNNGCMKFNGDDALGLFENGSLIDLVGYKFSKTDAYYWGASQTLVRNASVTGPTTTFNPEEWTQYPVDTYSYLGSHDYSGTTSAISSDIQAFEMAVATSNSLAVDAYPNPASSSDLLQVSLEEAGLSSTITLYDIHGRVKVQVTTTSQQAELSLNGLSSGVYMLSIDNENTSMTKRIVIR